MFYFNDKGCNNRVSLTDAAREIEYPRIIQVVLLPDKVSKMVRMFPITFFLILSSLKKKKHNPSTNELQAFFYSLPVFTVNRILSLCDWSRPNYYFRC